MLKLGGILLSRMDKIFRIGIVSLLLLLLIARFIRGRGKPYRSYDYLTRLKPPLREEIAERLRPAVAGAPAGLEEEAVEGSVEAHLYDEMGELLFCYNAEGRLTILRRSGKGRYRPVQELSVPLSCTNVALDPQDGKLYFEAGGYWFVYGAS